MARRSKSSVRRLPPALLSEIHARLDAGDTLDEILARVQDAGAKVSRSALGRYAQSYEKVGERLREMREVAAAFKRDLGDAAQSDAGQLLIQMVHTLAFKAGAASMDGEAPADHKLIANLARAVANLERARATSVDTAVTLREKFKAGLAKVEAEVKTGNLSAAEVLERAKAIVRGELTA